MSGVSFSLFVSNACQVPNIQPFLPDTTKDMTADLVKVLLHSYNVYYKDIAADNFLNKQISIYRGYKRQGVSYKVGDAVRVYSKLVC